MKNKLHNKKKKGFTLIEVLVVLAIAAILAFIAMPSFQTALQNSKQTSQLNSMISYLMFARSEAITRSSTVSLCASANSTCCTKSDNSTCATSAAETTSSWEKGWIVFSDENADGVFNDDADTTLCEDGEDCVLRTKEAMSGVTRLISKGFKDYKDDDTDALTYNVDGTFINSSPGRFIYCDGRGSNKAKEIVISFAGSTNVISSGLTNTCPQ